MRDLDYPKAILLNSSINTSTSEGSIDYWGLFNRYILSKWYVYLLCGAFFTTLAYVYYKKQQPVYAITSKLLIRERQTEYGSAEDFLNRSINNSSTSEKPTNEIEILSSFSLMNAVVNELKLGTRYYWKRQFSELDAYQGFPVVVDTFSLNPIENTSFTIKPVDEHSFVFSQGSFVATYQYGQYFTNQFGKFRFHRNSNAQFISAATMHIDFIDPMVVARNYQKNLAIELSDEKNKSSVLILTLRDEVPQRGKDVITSLVDKFNQLKSRANTEMTLKTLDLIDGRLANIGSELSSAETTVESYKLRNDIISETTTDVDITMKNVNDLTNDQRSIETHMRMLQAVKSDLLDTSDQKKLLPINPSLYDGKVADLIQPYNSAIMERERLTMKGLPSNPVVQSNFQKLKSLRSSIIMGLDRMNEELNFKWNKLQDQYDQSNARLRSVPIKERGLSDKVRIQSIKENLYVYLLQKREETALGLVSNYANAILFDPPYSSLNPVGPGKNKIFLSAAFGGFGLPFLFLFLLEFFKGSVQTEKDIKQIIPEKNILGVINHNKGGKSQLMLSGDQNLIAERFRSLRTSLQFHYREHSKCILITSSTSAEGKTFVAANLATSFALAKKSTIILDFDLRKPSINKYFKGNAEIGLSSFFSGDLSIDQIIQGSSDLSNLHYISGGYYIPNLVEMITENQMDTLFSYLKTKYDIVIIDSSPIGMISDAILLNKYVDKSLFVVRSGFSKKAMMEKARDIFDQNILVNPSIIFNGVKKQNDSYGYNYKQYSQA